MSEHKVSTSSSSVKDPRSTFQLYLELNRLHLFPVGSDMLFWPCGWTLAMAAYRTSRPLNAFLVDLALYIFASTLIHSAACVINDICDRELDAKERSKKRPLACGALSLSEALTCLTIEVAICIAMLAYTQDPVLIRAGLVGLFPLHGVYPLMKRVTNWPQAWLGLAAGWGSVVTWVHLVPNDRDTTYIIPGVLLVGVVCWIIQVDTIYACQDRADDIKAGNNSTAVLFGDYVRPILAVFATVFVCGLTLAGQLNQQGLWYYLAVGATALHLLWQLSTLQPDVSADCWEKFKSNGHLGYLLMAGLTMDYVVKAR
ncbi:hypothetical protein DXG01_012231 [Tephrocybe rancida]|nr:hypothetical protein DXG01_012231 [Tephrocybe rancida]